MSTYLLPCTVTPGQFSDEYAVAGQSFDGNFFSLFVPTSELHAPIVPSHQSPVEGVIEVELLKRQGDLGLIRLPRPTLENGRTVTVKLNSLMPTS